VSVNQRKPFPAPSSNTAHTYFMEQSPSGEANRFAAKSRNYPHFMEHEGSLLHTHVPTTCPYPEAA